MLLPPATAGDDQAGRLQQTEMLGHPDPCHIERLDERRERLAIVCAQGIQEIPPSPIGERLEDQLHDPTIGN
ncbi:MAG: hypothetical protein NVS3B21_09780 [Acidimicrobiales bacterium]